MRRKWWSSLVPAGLIMLVLASGDAQQAFAQSKSCSIRQEDFADAAIDKVTTWTALRRWQLQYDGCDDGGTAEAVNGTVITLLTQRWNELMRIANVFEDNQRLRVFLLHHINEDMSDTEETRIKASVRGRCSPGNLRLCGQIMDTMVRIDREVR